ncbi:SMI1/KNR4 family protein [Chryseobacterium fluminis]|uniref:SMI1/KNR4 family protein n=1 Tax=Chryseobacterium fluminis TaxID=2983606 RepID=UPI002255F63E|nr:SMI1/KNR4 family protein [Chryseobacterium sp. MMS21-Ot14]UZT98212.1 SMI1/KNR4 family protein [Chryseobacterium sp. MMS21-Ot14]
MMPDDMNSINLRKRVEAKNEIPSQLLYEKLLQKIDFNIDKEYLDFIAKYNGAEGIVGLEQYLTLWDIQNILSCNPYYEDVKECFNLFFFGTDGSNYGYAFDKVTGNIVGIDFLDIGDVSPEVRGNSFKDFLISLNQQ